MRNSTLQCIAAFGFLSTMAAWPLYNVRASGYVNFPGINNQKELSAGMGTSLMDDPFPESEIDLQKGLTAYFPFNGNANDESGNGHNLKLKGASLTTDRHGNENKAYLFTGKKNILPFRVNDIKRTDATFCFWVKSSKRTGTVLTLNAIPGKLSMIVRKVNHKYQLELKINKKKITLKDKVGYADPSAFNFITVMYDGKTIRFLVNSMLASEYKFDKKMVNSFLPYTIKKDPVFCGKAILDDIRIFSRVLNDAEVEALQSEIQSTPELSFLTQIKINVTSADIYRTVLSDGGYEITEMGVCWNTSGNPDTTDNRTSVKGFVGTFKSTMTGLQPKTKYYVRSYAVNKLGIGYSSEVFEFTTLPGLNYGSVSDIDGNVYRTISIGTQTWMAENLKTTRYADGTPIQDGTNNLSDPGKYYYIFDEDTLNREIYGLLYTWEAATNSDPGDAHIKGTQGACPDGWHVPGYAEKEALIDHLGGVEYAGDKMKEVGEPHWDSYNEGTNLSGFSALGSGVKAMEEDVYGVFVDFRALTYFWTSESYPNVEGNYFAPVLTVNSGYNSHYWSPSINYGAPVRCVKNNNHSYIKAPVVVTLPAAEVTSTKAKVGVTVESDGRQFRLEKGVCWSTSPNPDISDYKVSESSEMLTFEKTITGLKANTTYYIRAYGRTSAGISYGQEESFTTNSSSAMIVNDPVSKKKSGKAIKESIILDFYPNPATSTIQFRNLPENTAVIIYNSAGKVVITETVINNMVDVSNLKDGVYYIKIQGVKESEVKKLVKQ